MKLPKKQERKLQELHFTISYPVQKTLPLQITYFTNRKCGCMVNAFSSGKLAYSLAYHVTMVLFNFIVHICSSSPCLNNGTCSIVNASTGYICSCPPGYSGHHCESKNLFIFLFLFVHSR